MTGDDDVTSNKVVRQLDDFIGQPFFVWQATRSLAMRGAMLPESAAGLALR